MIKKRDAKSISFYGRLRSTSQGSSIGGASCIPDYSAGIDLSNGEVFIAPVDGFVNVTSSTGMSNDNAFSAIYLLDSNNNRLAVFYNRAISTDSMWHYSNVSCFVGKGQKFYTEAYGKDEQKFYPLKK